MKSQKGFTLVELLVVIAIVALIGIFAAVAVNAARSKQRDATRLSNVSMVQSALENYFNEYNTYPSGELLPLGDATVSACLGAGGFAAECLNSEGVFLRTVLPTHEDGLDDIVVCGEPGRNAFCYSQVDDGEDYVIYFELENTLAPVGLQQGVNCAVPEGMEAGLCND